MKRGDLVLFILAFSGLALLISAALGDQDKVTESYYYCEQVNLWESDADAGIEPHNRSGWPNYKEVDCDQ